MDILLLLLQVHFTMRQEENIEYFFNLMSYLIAFSNFSYFPLYEVDEYSKVTVKKVANGKIIIED